MSLLTIIQGAARAIGVPVPTTVVNNADETVTQMLRLSNLEGLKHQRMFAWAALSQLTTWTTVATEDQGALTTVIGSDFDRFVPGTEWDKSLIRPLPGPRSAQGWAQDHALVAAGPFYSFRIYGNPQHVYIYPVPSAGKTLSWEYTSKNWCQSSGGTGQSAWAADTDTGVLDENLLELALIVRFKATKGLNYTVDLVEYKDCLDNLRTSDGGNPRTLSLAGRNVRMPQFPVLPDGNWPTS